MFAEMKWQKKLRGIIEVILMVMDWKVFKPDNNVNLGSPMNYVFYELLFIYFQINQSLNNTYHSFWYHQMDKRKLQEG
jgi:hypothetical protein